MNGLLLGGNSQRNREWIHKVGSEFKGLFGEIVVHDYKHWENGADFVDIDSELEAIRSEADSLGEFVIFAKSVGSILSLMLISSGKISPKTCVFAGLPIKLAEEDSIDLLSMLKEVLVPVVFIQNTNDPVASFDKMKSLVEEADLSKVGFIETPGEDHSYNDFTLLRDTVASILIESS